MRRIFLFLLSSICCIHFSFSQQKPTQKGTPDNFSLANPQATAFSHLYFINEGQPTLSGKTIYGKSLEEEEKTKLAIQLKQIFDGSGVYVYISDIPEDPNYIDSVSKKNRYIVSEKYPEIYLQKYGQQWLYSEKTVQAIPRIHKRIFPFGADWLVGLTPGIAHYKFMGLEVWQWEGLLLMILLGIAIFFLFDWLFNFLIKRVLPVIFPQSKYQLNKRLIHRVASPISMLLVLGTWILLYPMLLLSVGFGQYITLFLRIAALLLGVIAVYRLVDLLGDVFAKLTLRTETAMDDQLVPLVKRIGKILVVAFGTIFILQNLNINVTALLAGVSIGGLALALAAQDTVRNFIGSLSIFVDRPFQIGDYIEASGMSGTVVEVGVRSTRLRAGDGSQVSVPNGDLANMTVTNHSIRTYRRYNTTLGITYDVTAAQMENFVNEVRSLVDSHPKTRDEGNLIYFHQMGASSLDIHFMVFFEQSSYEEMLGARQDLFLSIMRLAEESGISFAFPSTSVYVESLPERNKGTSTQ